MSALCAKHTVKGVAGEEGKEATDQQLPCEQKHLTSSPGCPVKIMQKWMELMSCVAPGPGPERKEWLAVAVTKPTSSLGIPGHYP